MENFATLIGEGVHVLRRGKNPNENAENEVSMTCGTT